MSRQFENKPACVGGCNPPYEEFVSKAGKPFNKCVACGNLVFSKSPQAKSPVKVDPGDCAHDGTRTQKVATGNNNAENKGRAYSVCGKCNGNFKWADEGDSVSSTSTTIPQMALSTTVSDLQSKYDALFKTVLVMQTQLKEQNEHIEQLYFATDTTSAIVVGGVTSTTAAVGNAETATNKRRKT